MQKQIMTAPHAIEFQEVPIPNPGANEVLIKIKRIGVCGSDIHVFHGQHPFTKYPVTQGHEVSGQIVALGADVHQFEIGQKVTIEPQVVCGVCYPCRHGMYNLCEELKVMGFQTTGAASEYFSVDAAKVTPFPQHMSYDEGAMIEPLAVAVHAINRAGDIKDKKVAVLGAGPIGILVAQSAKALGASQVMITDVSDYRLSIAQMCGTDFCINTAKRDFNEAMIECFGPDKADVIYDCAGNDTTMNQAILSARKGSHIILVAVFAKMANVNLAVLNDRELKIDTSMMYRHEDYVKAIEIVQEKKVQLKPLMSKHFAFDEYQAAYEYIDSHREATMKVLIDVDSDVK
ncbi:MAG TPA: alcohol dehydrogenase catalytic domain-containing protein [Candidatus Limiplasma sp.]|nr:alcohol dehydrogenase catalytic domain-containing protein [Candidatus Limiplasma sp.]HRX09484.1 alcohol dehydrogenase catalytic domain-containing protein [Candidatus Limiplasma sp.]